MGGYLCDKTLNFFFFFLLSAHEKTQRNLKCILLSERRQSEKATNCVIPNI